MNIDISSISQVPLVTGYHDGSWDEREVVAPAGTGARRAVKTVGTKASRRCLELEAHWEHLLPGIPNGLTFELIIPKLSWKDFPILASVNKAWLKAVRSRLLFDAIVRCHSTQPLVLLSYEKVRVTTETSNLIALYSPKENFCFEVPPIPCHPDGLPLFCQIVALGGKIYVVGGTTHKDPFISSKRVYIFDLAGKKEWEECASMREPRANFGCGVLGGKIYTFGRGMSSSDTGRESEVYDPTTNLWSPILPTLSSRSHHHVLIVGEELVDQNGDILEVYNPVQNEWRAVNCSQMPREIMISLSFCKIGDEWNHLKLSTFASLPPIKYDLEEGWSAAILVVDSELLVLAKYEEIVIILQSIGFGVEDGDMTWQVKGELPFSSNSFGSYRMDSIEL